MADRVRKVAYFSMNVPNRPGEGARILGALADAGVNLLAFTGFPAGGKAQIDFIPEKATTFSAAARNAKIRVSAKKIGFLIQGKDRKGAVARVLGKLAKSKINVTAIDALSAGKGRYGAILWVKAKDVNKAAKVLGAS